MDADAWDTRYAGADLIWSATPNAVVEAETRDLPPGRALDLASGEGRNAIWLAERGWQVTAADFSPGASARARQLADERLGDSASRLRTVTVDLTRWVPAPGSVDLVVLAYLQLAAAQRRAVHRAAAAALAPGGTFLLVAHHLDNLTQGVGGPQDAAVLPAESDVVADLLGTGVVVDRAERVERVVAGSGDGHRATTGVALDLLVRAHRPETLEVPAALPVRGVVFDFHHTLVHAGDADAWLRSAWADLGRDGDPAQVWEAPAYQGAVSFLDQLWEHARVEDPESSRDLDPVRHREVFDRTVAQQPAIDGQLAGALYAAMHRQWDAYEDVLPVLQGLRDRGIRVVMLSNVGYDLTPILERTGIADLLDGTVTSYALGVVKPDVGIFQRALDVLGLPAREVLMVGDAWREDAGAAALGIRTLILPRTDDPAHGLELVLRLV